MTDARGTRAQQPQRSAAFPDYSAWRAPIDKSAFAAFVSTAKAAGVGPRGKNALSGGASDVGFYSGVIIFVLAAFAACFAWAQRNWLRPAGFYPLFVGALILLVLGVVALLLFAPKYFGQWRRFYRADQFARQNGMQYLVDRRVPDYDGAIFHLSGLTSTSYIYTNPGSPLVEAGQLLRMDKETQLWTYLVAELPVAVPARAILRSEAKNVSRIWSMRFAQSVGPAVRLGPTHTLYSTAESVEVARRVFTPELVSRMAALEKKYGPVCADLYGNQLCIFALKDAYMYSERVIRSLFDTIATAQAAAQAATRA